LTPRILATKPFVWLGAPSPAVSEE
jgi:hypothetical protein